MANPYRDGPDPPKPFDQAPLVFRSSVLMWCAIEVYFTVVGCLRWWEWGSPWPALQIPATWLGMAPVAFPIFWLVARKVGRDRQ